jgi:hypothetical protein
LNTGKSGKQFLGTRPFTYWRRHDRLFPYSVFRIPYSVFRIPYSVFRIPYSVFRRYLF